jgi:peptidoglycan/LPS O-acetylase OafA/YrhL
VRRFLSRFPAAVSSVKWMTEAQIERPASPSASARLPALDGLRGVASLIVVLHHLYLIAVPALIAGGGVAIGGAYWWASDTPLKLATAGTEAVTVFFILSGLVVALPALRNPTFLWRSFFASRAVRLYLPVWVALLVAACAVWFVPRAASAATEGSWLATANARSVPIGYLLSQASLARVGYGVDNVLWSLRWELIFSVLLPVFVLVARRLGRITVPTIGACVVASTAGALANIDALQYLPLFFIGTAIAARLDDLRAFGERHIHRPYARWIEAALISVSGLLLIAGWLTRGFAPASSAAGVILEQLSVLGGLGLVTAAISTPGARRALERPAAQWLGRISFSLYLVHVPVLVTLAFAFGDGMWWLVGLVGVPASLLLALAFYFGVERTAHRLARRIGTAVAPGRTRPRASRPSLKDPTGSDLWIRQAPLSPIGFLIR